MRHVAGWKHNRIRNAMVLSAALGFGLAGAIALAQPQPAPTPSPASLDEKQWDSLLAAFAGTKGVSRPSQDAVMGFSLPTNVQATTVKEIVKRGGADVKAGDIIIKGDDAEDRILLKLQEERVAKPLAVDRAKAAMELSEVEYNRVREAFQRGGSGTRKSTGPACRPRSRASIGNSPSATTSRKRSSSNACRNASFATTSSPPSTAAWT